MKTTFEGVAQKKLAHENPSNTDSVAIVGLGYVGLPLALQADQRGFYVAGIDIDAGHIEALKTHNAPSFLNDREKQYAHGHTMKVSSNPEVAASVSTIIICVPTPVSHDHLPDLRPLISACESIAPYIKKDTLVVVESTVNPGICDEVVLPILSEGSGLTPEKDFLFAYCPERINPGDSTWDVRTIPRVLGAIGPKSQKRALEVYSKLIQAPIYPLENVKEAEAVKITENSFRDVNIAFINELAMSFKKLGIDIEHVIAGASTKPFGFLAHHPSCGVGGHCIPVDPYYLIAYAKQNGFTHLFLETARDINNNMPNYTISLLEQALTAKHKKLPGSKIALLGRAYKKDIPDVRESPAIIMEKELMRRGAIVRSFDPLVPSTSSVHSLEEALHNADAAIIATDHSVFCELTPKDFARRNVDIVIDGKNCLNKESFTKTTIVYHGIGR